MSSLKAIIGSNFRILQVLVALSLTGCSIVSIPQGTADLASRKPPETVSSAATNDDRLYTLLFGTSRSPIGSGFSEERDSMIHYGKANVKIPKGHVSGSLGENPLNPFLPNTKLALQGIEKINDREGFLNEMKSIRRAKDDYILVFIHGFNNTFESAAIRAAQIGVDLDVPDKNMMLFSWASRSSIPEYTVDEATVDASEKYLRAFLRTVVQGAGDRKVHVIAHSMGNRAFLRTVVASMSEVSGETRIKFGQIILAAADVDRDLFSHLAPNYLKVAERTTIYLSPYDYAVHSSDLVHQYPRVGCGDKPQIAIVGIDNVVSYIPEDLPAHAYFAEALPILVDIKNLLKQGVPWRPAPIWRLTDGFWTVGSPNPNPLVGRLRCVTRNTLRVNG